MKATETVVKAGASQVREHIVDTACRLFYSQGYNRTGINQIIEEAGVAKASLYYHFPSKDDLCVEYLQKRHLIFWEGRLEPYLEGITDPRERLLKTFECRTIFLEETDFCGCAYNRIVSELPQRSEKIDNQIRLQKDRQRNFFLSEVKKIKGLTPEQVNRIASTVFLLYDGAMVQSQLYHAAWPMQDAQKAVEELLPA
jgi:AcrR family transcriptional regulator